MPETYDPLTVNLLGAQRNSAIPIKNSPQDIPEHCDTENKDENALDDDFRKLLDDKYQAYLERIEKEKSLVKIKAKCGGGIKNKKPIRKKPSGSCVGTGKKARTPGRNLKPNVSQSTANSHCKKYSIGEYN